MRRSSYRYIGALLLCLGLWVLEAREVRADTTLSPVTRSSRSGYGRDASIDVLTAEPIDFSDLPGFGENSLSQSVVIENEDSTNDLLVRFIPPEESVASAPLTTPTTTGTLGEVQRIPAGLTVSFPVFCHGLQWQSETAAVAANLRVIH